jgi:hypothetical protein
MTKKEALGPERWAELTEPKDVIGTEYAVNHNFIYQYHDLLPEYELSYKSQNPISLNTYMIDFRIVYKVEYNKNYEGTKLLQLSISSRNDLRNKMANFFSRIPEEDKQLD